MQLGECWLKNAYFFLGRFAGARRIANYVDEALKQVDLFANRLLDRVDVGLSTGALSKGLVLLELAGADEEVF